MKTLILTLCIVFIIISESYSQTKSLDIANKAVYNSISPKPSKQVTVQSYDVKMQSTVNVYKPQQDVVLYNYVFNKELNTLIAPSQGIRNNPSLNIQRKNTFINLNNLNSYGKLY